MIPVKQGGFIFTNWIHPVHPLETDTGANGRPDDMAQLRLSTMLRVGSNTIARRFRSCVDNARCAGKDGWLGIRAGVSDQWGEDGPFNLETVMARLFISRFSALPFCKNASRLSA